MRRKPRKPSEFARIYGSRARVKWVKSLACCYCKASAPSHNAHTETGGMGYKADANTIAPLCAHCHRAYDEYRPPFHTVYVREFVKGAASMVDELWRARLAAQAAA